MTSPHDLSDECPAAGLDARQLTRYEEDPAPVANPERGWMRTIDPDFSTNTTAPRLTADQLNGYRHDDGITLVRKYYVIGAFRHTDLPLSVLDDLQGDLTACRQAGFKLVPRFTYTWNESLGPAAGQDAPLGTVLRHIEQLQPVLQNDYDAIDYFQTGLIGHWGEMWGSSNDLVGRAFPESVPNANTTRILHALADALPTDRMLVVRYPRQKRHYYPAPLTPAQAYDGSLQSRIGHLNDAVCADGTVDMNTYDRDPDVRAGEKAYLATDTRYVVASGEPANNTAANDGEAMLSELQAHHWSSMIMNQPSAHDPYAKWRASGHGEVFARRLGYRYVLVDSSIPHEVRTGGTFGMAFRVRNDGFANAHNPRPCEGVLRHRETGTLHSIPLPEDVRRNWNPGVTRTVNVEWRVPSTMPAGPYDVLLNLPDPCRRLRQTPAYSIRLANIGTWEPRTGFNNLLAQVTVRA